MYNLYQIITFLCAREGIKPGKLCNDIGLSRGMMSDLKAGRKKTLSFETLLKIAAYFNVSVDVFKEGVFDETMPAVADIAALSEIIEDYKIDKEKPTDQKADGLKEVAELFSKLSPEQQVAAKDYLRFLAKGHEDTK